MDFLQDMAPTRMNLLKDMEVEFDKLKLQYHNMFDMEMQEFKAQLDVLKDYKVKLKDALEQLKGYKDELEKAIRELEKYKDELKNALEVLKRCKRALSEAIDDFQRIMNRVLGIIKLL